MSCSSLVAIMLGAGIHAAAQSGGRPERFHEAVGARATEAARGGRTVVAGEGGWLFLASELKHIGAGQFWGDAALQASEAGSPDRADPLPAILDFHRQLQQNGIELWIVPVPPKAFIFPAALETNAALATNSRLRLDPHHQEFYRLLRAEGVRVVDLTDAFLAANATNGSPLYCRTDSHWSGGAIQIAARALASDIRSRDWYTAVPKNSYAAETREVSIAGDLGRDPGSAKETVALRFVTIGAQAQRVEPSETGPVLLLGDSHNLVFHAGTDMHARGAGLPDQLAYELGFPVDLIAVRGSGATPARVNLMRKARRDADYLKSKKAVIWCFAAREFTESDGWAKVPVIRTAN